MKPKNDIHQLNVILIYYGLDSIMLLRKSQKFPGKEVEKIEFI